MEKIDGCREHACNGDGGRYKEGHVGRGDKLDITDS